MGKRKSTHATEDQYGEFRSQDRDAFQAPAGGGSGGGGMRGGGGAGSSRRSNADLSFQRHVPKFLQPYAHMLPKPLPREDEPLVVAEDQQRGGGGGGDEDGEDDAAGEAEAIQRALQENPELAAAVGDKYLKKVRAQQEKDKGNAAFASQDYAMAAKHFTACIELDPREAVYFSNRSAAYANLGQYEEALTDAQSVLRLKPGWVKGHARLAAALYGLQQYTEAKEAYQKAMAMEPDDQALQRGYEKALTMELKHMRERKHVFKKSKPAGAAAAAAAAGKSGGSREPPAAGKPSMLSFADEETEEKQQGGG